MTNTVIFGQSSTFTFAANGDALFIPSQGYLYSSTGSAILGSSTFYNSVYISGDVVGGNGFGVQIGSGYVFVGITGHIMSYNDGISLNGYATVTNSGDIIGAYGVVQNFSTSGLTLNNSGTITGTSGYSFISSDASDTVNNSGHMVGNVELAGGNDFYDGRAGSVVGTVSGGSGDDTLVGGSGLDKIIDVDGNNWIVGGGGDDTITIGNYGSGTTIAFGGEANNGPDNSANDTLIVGGSAVNIFLNGGYVADKVTGKAVDWISGFENATGTSQADVVVGTGGNNAINGGSGADWLVGNGGDDRFFFTAASAANGDTIADFSKDIIDLKLIDANTTVAGNDAFIWQTTHTNNAAAELVFTNYGSGGVIQLYTNADNVVDATIYLAYASGAAAPLQGDFIL